MADTEVLERLETLVSPFGVAADVQILQGLRGLRDVKSAAAFSEFLPTLAGQDSTPVRPRSGLGRLKLGNSGYGIAWGDPDEARLIAIAEAAERYSAGDFGQPVAWASYQDLDGPALDLRRIPRCSARELAAPGCPLRAPDPEARIRWIMGTDLVTGEPTWVPAVMAHYGLPDAAPAERFWYQISTGFAVHSDPAEALVRGICEVIERDAIAVTWLQQLRLPVITQRLSRVARRMVTWASRHFIDTYLFDATTDMGVPAVICLQIAPHDEQCAQNLSCATGRSITSAAEKALLEACRRRGTEPGDDDIPDDFAGFTSLADGARYMAMPARAPAFQFLVDGASGRRASAREMMPENSMSFLARLVFTLAGKHMQILAVDRTTRELAAVGLTAVNVVVPELQPMSLLPLAQYRGHPRLYSAPALMGYPSLPEEELNPWPVPYA